MSLKGRTVLATGAGGFIGSHLAEALVEAGAQVRAFVLYDSLGSFGWLDNSPMREHMEIITGDLTDRDGLLRAMAGCDAVFHLGALIAIPYSYVAPASYVRTNVEGTLNVLQAARSMNVGRVVHVSTSEVYGSARYVPIDEAHPLQAQSPYAATKIGADKLAESFYLSYGLPVTTVRPFNTFGPRQSARAVIPTTVLQCMAGAEIRLGNLAPTRDFTFVADTVRGMMLAGQVDGVIGKTINLGTGREISIGELAKLIGQAVGKKPRVVVDSNRVRPEGSEVERLCADATRASELLGWQPQVTLEEGISRVIQWLSENVGRYRSADYVI